ncbi:hypothetical protein ACIPD0_26095, partial [Escherichia coli]|uniref:hypothetical protein n=1 Tax=Escherichia coli TaxID=562 RepID=UPI00382ABA14
ARRRHPDSAGATQDASGFNGRVTASFHPREKIRVHGALWREFAALESSLVSFSRNTGASAVLAYDASAQLKVEAGVASE